MAEHLEIAQGGKADKYNTLYKQIVSLIEKKLIRWRGEL